MMKGRKDDFPPKEVSDIWQWLSLSNRLQYILRFCLIHLGVPATHKDAERILKQFLVAEWQDGMADEEDRGIIRSDLLASLREYCQSKGRELMLKSRPEGSPDEQAEAGAEGGAGLEPGAEDEELLRQLLQNEAAQVVWEAVYDLPERTVILLYYFCDLVVPQIAELLATSPANIRVRLLLGHKQLAERLREKGLWG